LYTDPSRPSSTAPLDPLTRAKQIYRRVISRTLASGTTTAAYYATIHVEATNALADLAFELGQRALIGRVCMDEARTCPEYYRDESTEASIANSKACIQHCRSLDPSRELINPILTPRFAPSCQPLTLAALGELARKEDMMIQTHISENVKEIQMVRDMFPESSSYAAVYDDAGLLTEKTILAHAVHLSKVERALVKERKAKVAHCPASNSALGSGYCPVRTLLEDGIDVGLGTDVSGGFSVSVLEAVRQAYLVSRTVAYNAGGDTKYNVGVAEGLHLATVGGAKVVGMEGRIGAFRKGMFWDVQEVELGEVNGDGVGHSGAVDVFGWESWEEKVAKWVWNGDDRNVKRVWVGGKLVHEQGMSMGSSDKQALEERLDME
jgi:guanine deaminase